MKNYYALLICMFSFATFTKAQQVMFDFDNAPLHVSLPLTLNSGALTANLAATGSGFSIQEANTLGFTPQGFGGNCVYPNSIFAADLLISFNQPLSDFSILYACQELGCDDAATMRITAYDHGAYVGTNTRTATFPGTYPTDTLSCSFAQVFDSVVIHYDSPPPTCQDYGTIFLADNMLVTINTSSVQSALIANEIELPNPMMKSGEIKISLRESRNIKWVVNAIDGRTTGASGTQFLNAGLSSIHLNVEQLKSGYYFFVIDAGDFILTRKLLVLSQD